MSKMKKTLRAFRLELLKLLWILFISFLGCLQYFFGTSEAGTSQSPIQSFNFDGGEKVYTTVIEQLFFENLTLP